MDYTPGKGGGMLPVTGATMAAFLPFSSAKWIIPAAAALVVVLAVWGVSYLRKTKKAN